MTTKSKPAVSKAKCWIIVHRVTNGISSHCDGRVRAFTLASEAEEGRALMQLSRQHRVAQALITEIPTTPKRKPRK